MISTQTQVLPIPFHSREFALAARCVGWRPEKPEPAGGRIVEVGASGDDGVDGFHGNARSDLSGFMSSHAIRHCCQQDIRSLRVCCLESADQVAIFIIGRISPL
jgi:hypothetical protein